MSFLCCQISCVEEKHIYINVHQISSNSIVTTGDVILKYPEQCFLTPWIELQVVGPKTIGWKKVLCCWCWGRVKRWGRKNDEVSRYESNKSRVFTPPQKSRHSNLRHILKLLNKLNLLPWLRESSNKLLDMLSGNFMFSVLSACNYNELTPYTPLLPVTEAFIHLMLSYFRTKPKIGKQFCNPCATLLAVDTCLPVNIRPSRPRRWVSGFHQFLGENIWQGWHGLSVYLSKNPRWEGEKVWRSEAILFCLAVWPLFSA